MDEREQRLNELRVLGEKLSEVADEIMPTATAIDDDGIRNLYTDLDERQLRNVVLGMHKQIVSGFIDKMQYEGVKIPQFLLGSLINGLSKQLAEIAISDTSEGGSDKTQA